MEFTKKENGTSSIVLDVTKAYNDNTDVTGGRVEAIDVIHALEQGNFARMYGGVWNTTSGSIKLPTLSGITFASEATVNTSRTQGGTLGSVTAVVENLVGSVQVSKPSMEDINGLDMNISMLMMQEAAKKEAQDAVTILAAGSFTAVNTGAATALPAANAIIGKMADMKAALSSAYLFNAAFYVSREVYALLAKSNNTTLNYNPARGVMTLFGFDVVTVDYFDDGNAAGENSAYFGDMSRGLAFVSRKTLEIGRYMETSPGFVTYFGDLRSVSVVHDTAALIALNTAV